MNQVNQFSGAAAGGKINLGDYENLNFDDKQFQELVANGGGIGDITAFSSSTGVTGNFMAGQDKQ